MDRSGWKLLDWALYYAEKGWPVFPTHAIIKDTEGNKICSCMKSIRNRPKDIICLKESPGKHPRTKRGLQEATTDPKQLKIWFNEETLKYNPSNIAIRCGSVRHGGSGFVAIDVDKKNNGLEAFVWMLESLGPLPETPSCKTGSGGNHVYVWYPEGVEKLGPSAGKIALFAGVPPEVGTGIDIRADNSYVVVPPSNHLSGDDYKWTSDPELELCNLPSAWTKLFQIAATSRVDKGGTIYRGKDGQKPSAPPVEEKLHDGTRDAALASIAGTLRNRGLGYNEIFISLSAVNDARCVPPKTEGDIERIARSYSRYDPGSILPDRKDRVDVADPESIGLVEGWVEDLGQAQKAKPDSESSASTTETVPVSSESSASTTETVPVSSETTPPEPEKTVDAAKTSQSSTNPSGSASFTKEEEELIEHFRTINGLTMSMVSAEGEYADYGMENVNRVRDILLERAGLYQKAHEMGLLKGMGLTISKLREERAAQAPQDTPDVIEEKAARATEEAKEKIKESFEKLLDSPDILGAWTTLFDSNLAKFELEMTKLNRFGLAKADIKRLGGVIKQLSKQRKVQQKYTPGFDTELITIKSRFKTSPVHDLSTIPPDWDVTVENGIERLVWTQEGLRRKKVCSDPLVISSSMFDIRTNERNSKLAWKFKKKWETHIVARNDWRKSTHIVDACAKYGLDVASTNTKDVIDYLRAFESENIDVIEVEYTTSQMGPGTFQNEDFFMCGTTQIGGKNVKISLYADDAGTMQRGQSVHRRGDETLWGVAASMLLKYDNARVGFYASFVPPMMHMIGTANYCIDYCGSTSRGKTTVARLCASVWGDPDERNPTSAVGTWNTTKVFRERGASVTNGIPYILDETKHAVSPREVSRTVYEFVTGQSKGRGSIKGTQKKEGWRTIMILTGEVPIISMTSDGGTKARILTMWGFPLDATTTDIGNEVKMANSLMLQNYGHAGPKFVKWLYSDPTNWDAVIAVYQKWQRHFTSIAPQDGVGVRMVDYMASIETACEVVHNLAQILPWKYKPVITKKIYKQLTGKSSDRNVWMKALRAFLEWAHQNQASFVGRHTRENGIDRFPRQVPYGRWDKNLGEPFYGIIGIYRNELVRALKELGFEKDIENILLTWRDEGVLKCAKGRMTSAVRLLGSHARLICVQIPKEDLDEMILENDKTFDDPEVADILSFQEYAEKRIKDLAEDTTIVEEITKTEDD